MPGLHVDDLKGNISAYARAYMFNIWFNDTPVDLDGGENKAAYLVKSGTLPTHTIEPIEVPWQGQVQKIAGTHTFDTWEVTFNVDQEAKIKKEMDLWARIVHNPENNFHGEPKFYYGSARVELLDHRGKPVLEYEIVDIWPSEVGAIELGQETKEVAQLSVTFTYNYHKIV